MGYALEMNAGGRIAQELKALDISGSELARRVTRLGCKCSQGAIAKMIERDTERPRCLPELAQVLNVSERWLLTGRGQKGRDEPMPAPAITDIPIVSWISAGEMSRNDLSDVEIGRLALGGLPKGGDWIALRVEGDSMDRISPTDSIIVLNRKDTRLVPNACYVIADPDGNATYKRYRPGPPMRFEPVSTHPEYEPLFPAQEPTIIGRVRRSILEM